LVVNTCHFSIGFFGSEISKFKLWPPIFSNAPSGPRFIAEKFFYPFQIFDWLQQVLEILQAVEHLR